MKLIGTRFSYRVTACALAFDACGVEYTNEYIEPQEMKTEKLLVHNPQGKIPTAVAPEGPLYETTAIISHAARVSGKLGGGSPYEQALVDQWLSWANSEIAPTFINFYYQTVGYEFPSLSFKPDDIQKGKESFLTKLAHLNSHLQGKQYLVGSSITVADLTMASFIYQPIAFALGEKERSGIQNIVHWLETVAKHPSWIKFYGPKLRLADQAFRIPQVSKKDDQKGGEKAKQGGGAAGKKDDKPKEDKPKEEKPKAAAKQVEEDEYAEPKQKDPEFPPTELNLMTFKTFFVNEKDMDAAMAEFWKQYKDGEWSLWHLKYIKYPGECEVVYRTNNLLRTFLSRLEHIRKWLFGTHLILGDEPQLEIEGVWLVRGPELFDQIKEIDVYDTYKWTKLDISKPEDKALVTDFWTHRKEDEEKVQGKTIRTFKWIK